MLPVLFKDSLFILAKANDTMTRRLNFEYLTIKQCYRIAKNHLLLRLV